MASGYNSTVITNPNGGKYNLLISWNENSTSVSDNTSNITVTAKLTKNNSRFSVNNAGVLRAYWHDDRTNSDTEFASLAVTELGYNSTERVASGTRNMTHKDDGTLNGYAYASWTRNSTYGGYVPVSGTCSTGWTALTAIARKATVKTVQNFNDEGNPVLGYENKAGNSANTLQAGIFKTDGTTVLVGYRDISKTGSSYTFNLTTAERNTLRAAIPNSNSMKVRFYVKTVIGSNTFYDYKEATFSITNANPTFKNFTFRDGNSATLAITGNDQYIIQNKSSLVAEISTTNKAVANKSATMSSYVFEIGSYSGTENYSTSAITKTIGTINATANQNLKITAKDSRGNSTAVSKTVNIVPYSSPVVNASATRQNNFENNTTIKVSGSASLLKVNNVVKNGVNATNGVQYRYKDASTSTWGAWTNIASSYNTSSGAITTTDFVLSLDNTKAWNFEFRVIDKLETKTVSISVSQGQPQFFIGADGRVSVGGLPTRAISNNELGQLEVFGNIYGKEGRYDVNTAVSPDTTTQWSNQFGNGHFFIKYSEKNKFASQPSQFGILEVWIDAIEVRQIWHQLPSGKIWTRCGNASGWSTTRWHIVETRDSSSQGGLWSSFYFDDIVNNTDVVVYTKKGTELTLRRGNGGVVLYCGAGAKNINIARCSWVQSYSPSINGNYGVHGLASSSKIYTRFLGALVNNGSAGVGEFVSTAEKFTPGYGDLASTAGGGSTRSASYCSMTMTRIKGTIGWEIQGNVSSDGVATSMDFDAHITVPNVNYIPSTYQRGATNNNTRTSWCLFEVFEP